MFRCERCGDVFEHPYLLNEHYSDEATFLSPIEELCPNCRNDEFVEVIECKNCSELSEDCSWGVCPDCYSANMDIVAAYGVGDANNETVRINGFLSYCFSPSEIEEVLKREIRNMKEPDKTFHVRDYLTELSAEHADYIIEHGVMGV